MFSILFYSLLYKKNSRKRSVKRLVQVSGNRSGRILSLQLGGAGHLIPKKSLGRGAFDQRKGPHGGEFDQKKKKSNARESARGGGGGDRHSWI